MFNLMTELRTCTCGTPTVYYGGRYMHLTDTCPDDWRNKLPQPQQYTGNKDMLLLAARHLDPNEGVMREGHTVTASDLAALQKVLDAVATVIRS